jgi:hypothetical protein
VRIVVVARGGWPLGMTASVERLERLLIEDLESLGDRLADDRVCTDLYRAITNRALYKLTPRA